MKVIKFLLVLPFAAVLMQISVSAQNKQFKALLVTTTNGWHHESLHYGVVALKALAVRNYFAADGIPFSSLSSCHKPLRDSLMHLHCSRFLGV